MGGCFTSWNPEKHDEKDHKVDESLFFCGVVNDNEGMTVEDVVVMVFACYTDGIEKPLSYTFTDRTGKYFISIPKPPDYDKLVGFKARAGKSSIPEFNYPINCEDEPCQQLKRDFVQDKQSDDRYEPGWEEILNEETDSVPAKNYSESESINDEAGDSEYRGKPEFEVTLADEYNNSWGEADLMVTSSGIDLNLPKEVIIEGDQLPDEEATCRLREENRIDKNIIENNEALFYGKKGLTSIATFLIIVGLLSTFRRQKG